jgi:hypothetical protein
MRKVSRLILLLAALHFAGVAATAQVQTAGYAISPLYSPGQQISLLLESRIQDARDGSAEQIYRAPVTLRVVRNGTSGTQLEWQAGKGVLENSPETNDPMLRMAERIITELGLLVQLDPAGRYLGVQNESTLKSRIEVFTNLLIPQATAKITDSTARQRARTAMKAALTPEMLLSAARKELDLYFGVSGLRLEPGKVTRRKSGLLNPFGSTGTLSGEMEIKPEPENPGSNEVTVEFSQHYNPRTTFQMNSGKTQTEAANDELAGMTLDDTGEFLLDRTTWQVRQVRHVRTIRRNKEAVRVETTLITLQ